MMFRGKDVLGKISIVRVIIAGIAYTDGKLGLMPFEAYRPSVMFALLNVGLMV